MEFSLNFNKKEFSSDEVIITTAFCKTEKVGNKEKPKLVNSHWSKEMKEAFSKIKVSEAFTGTKGKMFAFNMPDGSEIFAYGMGEKSKVTFESLRRLGANICTKTSHFYSHVSIDLDGFIIKAKIEESLSALIEGFELANYKFDKYISKKTEPTLSKVTLDSKEKKTKQKKAQAAIDATLIVTDAIKFGRDLVNEPPNVLNSETYAKLIEKDVKKLKRVKAKILGNPELKKEKMGLFLSVNAGSAFGARLVHLTYTPSKVTSKTKHIALVGKGLTFDTGGYSLKPAASIINMKFDMAGSATMYAAFKALAGSNANVKITCILGMTDNAINSKATLPDSIITARNGKTVEVLNTDAEGRLVLADCLDYACDQKPDAIIDCATLTGAVLVSLGHEVCGLMGNDQKMMDKMLKSAKAQDEYLWQLPVIEEFHTDMKSPVADLKNIGGSRFGGSSKAAAFLSNFIKNDIPWSHLDIAGAGDSQGHLPYCPKKGASGLMVRTVFDFVNSY